MLGWRDCLWIVAFSDPFIYTSGMGLRIADVRKATWRNAFVCIALLGMLFVGSLFFFTSRQYASAAAQSWMSGEPSMESERHFDPYEDADNSVRGACKLEEVSVMSKDINDPTYAARPRVLCVSRGPGFSVGQSKGELYSRRGFFVAPDGGLFYELHNVDDMIHIPGTDTVVVEHSRVKLGVRLSHDISRFTDFRRRVSKNADGLTYTLRLDNPDYTLRYENATLGHLTGFTTSNNGRYLIYTRSQLDKMNLEGHDTVHRVDMHTGKEGIIGRAPYINQYVNIPGPEYVISNDGAQVIAGGDGSLKVWHVTAECLVDPYEYKKARRYDDSCENRHFTPKVQGVLGEVKRKYVSRMMINDDFTRLTYYYDGRELAQRRVVELSIPGGSVSTGIDYLAMGDSYSSGEGDVDGGGMHYVKGTGAANNCHLSRRSYPYHLAHLWGIRTRGFQSIACSGARVAHDYIARVQYYPGQNEHTRRHLTTGVSGVVRDHALRHFSPGYLPQLEFVKRYRPKVVTLTGGGNDVGFADVLSYCATTVGPCRYAYSDAAREELIHSIRNQYGVMSLLLRKIRMASPETKVYLIGYPQFIDQPAISCSLNGAALGRSERALIREMVTEMNNVLWRAATDSGVPFVDIEDSLAGGQLCAGSRYMTGIHQISADKMLRKYFQESFHPNAAGHAQIASTIYEKVNKPLAIYSSTARNALRGDEYEKSPIVKMLDMVVERLVKVGSVMELTVEDGQFRPGSKVKLSIYSEETELGTVDVNSEGGLGSTISLPKSIGAGRHVLALRGVNVAGKAVTLYQFITVAGTNSDDIDADGIRDSEDRCLFVEQWHDERSGANVCAVRGASNFEDRADTSTAGGPKGEYVDGGGSLAATGSDRRPYGVAVIVIFIAGVVIVRNRSLYESNASAR